MVPAVTRIRATAKDKAINLLPPTRTVLRVSQEPAGKKHENRQGKDVTVDLESTPFPGAGWDVDTEVRHILNHATKEEVRRRTTFKNTRRGYDPSY